MTLQELYNNNEIIHIDADIYRTSNIDIIDKINIENLLMIKTEEDNEISSILLVEKLCCSIDHTINQLAYNFTDLDKINNIVKEILLKYNIYDDCIIYYSEYYNRLCIVKKYNNLIDNIKDIISNKHDILIAFYKNNYVVFQIFLKHDDYDNLENIIQKIKAI